MKTPKRILRAVSLALAALLTLACLTACGGGGGLFSEKLSASELEVSAETLEVQVDKTVYFVVAAVGYPVEKNDEDPEKTKSRTYELELKDTAKSDDLWEGSVFGNAIRQTESQPEGSFVDLQNGFYVMTENEEDAKIPYLTLGINNINFITKYVQEVPSEGGAGIVRVCAVKGLKAGSSTWTFKSGDLEKTVTVNVIG